MKTVLILTFLPLVCFSSHLPLSCCVLRSQPISGFLDDYAFIIYGLLDLYEATLQTEWLRWAEELQLRQDKLFWDETGGGYFCSDPSDSTVLLQLKEGESDKLLHRFTLAGIQDSSEEWEFKGYIFDPSELES